MPPTRPRKPTPKSSRQRTLDHLKRSLFGGPSHGRPKGGRFPALGAVSSNKQPRTAIGMVRPRESKRTLKPPKGR